MKSALAASASQYNFVVGHHSPFTSQKNRGDTANLARALEPAFGSSVSAYIAGHDHNLQILQRNQMHYLISGGGGMSDLHPIDENATKAKVAFAVMKHGFLHLRVGREQWEVSVIDQFNSLLYHAVLDRK